MTAGTGTELGKAEGLVRGWTRSKILHLDLMRLRTESLGGGAVHLWDWIVHWYCCSEARVRLGLQQGQAVGTIANLSHVGMGRC
ncbi:hypothetical protein MLD38_023293 [Melastoma candidum]|uniref:Uncharacterized protein n=1 Tax=Melastoma candidum TaxID=119954 RepID=A0ACB9QM17_9MYRT|nr:hypothetical protein MLD38_023293 [Melastoma candidum]